MLFFQPQLDIPPASAALGCAEVVTWQWLYAMEIMMTMVVVMVDGTRMKRFL